MGSSSSVSSSVVEDFLVFLVLPSGLLLVLAPSRTRVYRPLALDATGLDRGDGVLEILLESESVMVITSFASTSLHDPGFALRTLSSSPASPSLSLSILRALFLRLKHRSIPAPRSEWDSDSKLESRLMISPVSTGLLNLLISCSCNQRAFLILSCSIPLFLCFSCSEFREGKLGGVRDLDINPIFEVGSSSFSSSLSEEVKHLFSFLAEVVGEEEFLDVDGFGVSWRAMGGEGVGGGVGVKKER